MLRLAHISDTHLGKRQYGSDIRKQDYMDAFEEAIDRCIELEVDAVIHTGDLFDDPSPDIQTLDETIRVLEKLEDTDIKFYGIVGNHERKRAGQWMDVIQRLGNTARLSTEPTYISNENGDSVTVYGFDAIRKPQWNTTDFTVTPPDTDQEDNPIIVCFHELFEPPLQGVTADYKLEPVLEELNVDTDLIALGDNHQPEEAELTVNDTTTTAYYPGSTEKTSRNDPETHAFVAIGIEDSEITRRQPVELTSPRPFITTEIVFEEGDGIEVVEHALNETNFSTPPESKNPVGVIRLAGENTGVTHNDIRRLARDLPIALVKIDDNRQSSKFKTEDMDTSQPTTDVISAIDDAVSELEVTKQVQEIDTLVRDTDSVPASHIRDEVAEILNNGDTQ